MFATWAKQLNTRQANVYDPSAILLLEQVPTADLKRVLKGVNAAVNAGQAAKCPLPLATGAMDMLLCALRIGAERRL